jgi:hypothetical protein
VSITGGETYVIRIYRQAAGDPPQLIGLAEQVRSGKKTAFHTMEELCRILARQARMPATSAKKKLGGSKDTIACRR